MKRICIFLICIFIVMTMPLVQTSCNMSSVVIGTVDSDNIDISYKYGQLEFIDQHYDDIYSHVYNKDYYTGYYYMTITDDRCVYTFNTHKYLPDNNPNILELCQDPVCNHNEPESCIQSFYGIHNVIHTDSDIYFTKANGVYRYSLNTLTTEPYAVFNMYVPSQFLMGRYLFILVGNSVFVKVNIETDEAVVLEHNIVGLTCIYPYEGMLYCMDDLCNIYQCDSNFNQIQLLVSSRTPACEIMASYQVYKRGLYYTDAPTENEYYLFRYDLDTGITEKIAENVYVFCIDEDIVYFQEYAPGIGSSIDNGTTKYSIQLFTGTTIYSMSLSNLGSRYVFINNNVKDSRLCGYFMFATKKYIYVGIEEFMNESVETVLYRVDKENRTWQRIAGEHDY